MEDAKATAVKCEENKKRRNIFKQEKRSEEKQKESDNTGENERTTQEKMKEINAAKSFEKCSKIIKKLHDLHMGTETKRFLEPGGYKAYKKIIKNIIDEYDKETKKEIMASEIKKKYVDEKKLEENFLIEVEKAVRKIEEKQKEVDKVYLKMQELLVEMQAYLTKMESGIDEENRKKIANCYQQKIKYLKEGNLDEANKIDNELRKVYQINGCKADGETKKSKQNAGNNVMKNITKNKKTASMTEVGGNVDIVSTTDDDVDTESIPTLDTASTATESTEEESSGLDTASTAADVIKKGKLQKIKETIGNIGFKKDKIKKAMEKIQKVNEILEYASDVVDAVKEGDSIIDIASTAANMIEEVGNTAIISTAAGALEACSKVAHIVSATGDMLGEDGTALKVVSITGDALGVGSEVLHTVGDKIDEGSDVSDTVSSDVITADTHDLDISSTSDEEIEEED